MARKSAARRLNELSALRLAFKENPSAAKFYSWTVEFIGAMILKLERGKGLSKKMRDKIDSIIEEGVLPIPNSKEADELEAWGKFLDNKKEEILRDFAYRMRKGWKLSEKQIMFRDSLVTQAMNTQLNGFWEPSEEVMNQMDIVYKLYYCYSSSYWYSHPGHERCMKKLINFLKGTERGYEESDWEKARSAVRGKIKLFENPRFSCGHACYIYQWEINSETNVRERVKFYGIVTSDIKIENNQICYDVLVSGTCKSYNHELLKKR